MKSIFFRILLWYFATLIVCIMAVAVTSMLLSSASPNRQGMFSRTMSFQLAEARRAYETGSTPELTAFMERLNSHTRGRYHLVDSRGIDLLTHEDYSELLGQIRRPRFFFPLFTRPPSVFAWGSPDGKYRLVGEGMPSRDPWATVPYYLWIVLAMGLFCYILFLHLASPLRKLRETVDQFGRGNLSVRADANRSDEFGDLAKAFNEMAHKTEQLLTAERRLLQDISHELRSPLARLEFAVELARTSPDREGAISRIKRDVDRLSVLVGELLDVARTEGESLSPALRNLSLDALLRNLAEDCSFEAEAKDCRIELQAEPSISMQGDPELLRRAIENILRNAIRHAPEGSTIHLRLQRKDQRALIEIQDQGPGIPEEALSQIFKPFFRVETDRNRNSGGVGLGLAIAQRAVILHHGTLHAENSLPGLRVEIHLPLTPKIA